MRSISFTYCDTKNLINLMATGDESMRSAYVLMPDGNHIYEPCYKGDEQFLGQNIFEMFFEMNRPFLKMEYFDDEIPCRDLIAKIINKAKKDPDNKKLSQYAKNIGFRIWEPELLRRSLGMWMYFSSNPKRRPLKIAMHPCDYYSVPESHLDPNDGQKPSIGWQIVGKRLAEGWDEEEAQLYFPILKRQQGRRVV